MRVHRTTFYDDYQTLDSLPPKIIPHSFTRPNTYLPTYIPTTTIYLLSLALHLPKLFSAITSYVNHYIRTYLNYTRIDTLLHNIQ